MGQGEGSAVNVLVTQHRNLSSVPIWGQTEVVSHDQSTLAVLAVIYMEHTRCVYFDQPLNDLL